jgi:uncharacterized protein YecT (DUF1311 family)
MHAQIWRTHGSHQEKYFALAGIAIAAASAFGQALGNPEPPAVSIQVAERDAALNAAFKEALSKLSSEGRKQLLEDQRQWLRKRNSECGLLPNDAASDLWPRNLSTAKAECVMHVSQERIREINSPSDTTKPNLDDFADNSLLVPVDEFTLPMGHSSGKWYAEVIVDRDIVENAGKNGFYSGIDNVNGYYAIELAKSRLPPDQSVEVIGLMVDMDNRLFNWRTYSNDYSAMSRTQLQV